MPKPLTLETVVEKNKVASGVALLVLIDIEIRHKTDGSLIETLRFARNDEDVTHQGQVYTRSAFDFSITESSETTSQVSVNVRDPSGTVAKKVDEYDGGVGWRIRFMIVNAEYLDLPPEIEELVYVMGSRILDYTVSFTLGARNPLGQRFPARAQWRDRCQWRYRGEECGYAGTMTSCDYSLQGDNGCAAHGNTLRFGAFPGIRNRT